MPEPCRSCDRREVDWGGCRCQAFAFAGRADVTDPACSLSPLHESLVAMAEDESGRAELPPFVYRRPNNAPSRKESARPVAAVDG